MSHTCHAFECEMTVPPKMFMCRTHWFMLPKATRDEIWQHYRPGQERGKGITNAYAEAAKRAVIAVAAREDKTVPADAPELLVYDLTARARE